MKQPTSAITAGDDDKVSKIISQHVKHSAIGLEFSEKTTFDQWSAAIPFYLNLRDKSKFWLGDAIIFGATHFADRYTQAIEMTGRTRHDLINIVSVCERIEKSRRRELSFDHHAAVAYLPPQEADRILKEAEIKRLTREDVRDAAARAQGKPTKAEREAERAAKPAKVTKTRTTRRGAPTIDVQTHVTQTPAGAPAQKPTPTEEKAPAQPAAEPEPAETAEEAAIRHLDALVTEIGKIDWASLKPLQKKSWLKRLLPLDELIDSLTK